MANAEMQVTVDTRGLERAVAQMRPKLRQVIQIAARNVEAEAKRRVPVDTGATRNSIAVTTESDGLGASIGPSTEYSAYLEFGTSRMAARPYMRPALEKERGPFIAAVTATLREAERG